MKEQITAFSDEIDKVIARFRSEFDLSYAAAIGVLEFAKQKLLNEALGIEDDE